MSAALRTDAVVGEATAKVYVLGVLHEVPAGSPINTIGKLAGEAGLTKFTCTINGEEILTEDDLPSTLEANDEVRISKEDYSG